MQHNNAPKQAIDNAQNIINEFNGVMQRFHADMQKFVRGMDLLTEVINLDKNDLYELHRYTAPYRELRHNPFKVHNKTDYQNNPNTDSQTSEIIQRFSSQDFTAAQNAFRRGAQQYESFLTFMNGLERKYAKEFNKRNISLSDILTSASGNSMNQPVFFDAESIKLIQTMTRYQLLLRELHSNAVKNKKNAGLIEKINATLNKVQNDTNEINASIKQKDLAKKYSNKAKSDYLADKKILALNIFNDTLLAIEKAWNKIDKSNEANKPFMLNLIQQMDALQTNTDSQKLLTSKKDREKLISNLQKSLKQIQRAKMSPKDKIHQKQLASLLSSHIDTLKQVNKVLSKEKSSLGVEIKTERVAVPPRPASMPAQKAAPIPPRPTSMPAKTAVNITPKVEKVAVPPRPASMPAPKAVPIPPRPTSMPAPAAKTHSLFKERQTLIGQHRKQGSKQETQEPPISPRAPRR